ncbi:FkbM family methyltransferase [Methylomonas montana]|uniref:FkbM family methyltransferase n=1 Tax=Methylomonas montana TaxID=3058963 RepID=UPI0026583690|nr:FkbM family methyltransferase [Methylomonas montana]WKJ88629.1 FkbM family methyltransferase [Methylomonas montana]
MLRLINDSFRPLYRCFTQPNLYTFYKLSYLYEKSHRYYPFYNINFNGFNVDIVDGPSFVWQYKDIFVDESYSFPAITSSPVIYDCGANIGMSILFFKKQYKNSKIVAFEPDKKIFSFLQKNVESNHLEDVCLVNKAVWINNNGVCFLSDGADGGTILKEGVLNVESVRLKEYLLLEERIDLLKIDIEGAEVEVLADCASQLDRVQNIFIEYHSLENKPQTLSNMLRILEQQGFRYFLETVSKINKPFLQNFAPMSMDLQLNIYGYRL